MAGQQMCDGPDQGPAMFIVHNLETVEFTGLCVACMADFAQAFLQAVDPSRLAAPPAPPGVRKRKGPAPAAAVADDNKEGEGNGELEHTGPAPRERRPAARAAD